MEEKEDFFKFYSMNWIEGTSEMTMEEKGLYIELLANQHIKGSLPSDTKRLCKIARLSEEEFLDIWHELKKKFILDRDGRYFNIKLKKVLSSDGVIDKETNVMEHQMWIYEKKSFFGGGDWIFKFCRDKDLKLEEFDASAKEFISDIELKEDYKTVKELRSHFTNWFNIKKKNGTKFINGSNSDEKLGTSAARIKTAKDW